MLKIGKARAKPLAFCQGHERQRLASRQIGEDLTDLVRGREPPGTRRLTKVRGQGSLRVRE